MRDRLKHIFEGGVLVGMRLWGVAAILMSSFGILFCLVMIVLAFVGPASERASLLIQSAGFGFGFFFLMYLGLRVISIKGQELDNGPARLAALRDRFEAWINRERKDV
jgi:hypothetical protein